ncbi:hypothetical protein D9M70_637090 [compost metagenome]
MFGKIGEWLVLTACIARRFRVDIFAVIHIVGGRIGSIHFALLALCTRAVRFIAFS